MDQIPEDISNKRFIASNPPEPEIRVEETVQTEEIVSHPAEENTPVRKEGAKKVRQRPQAPKIDTKELRRKIRERRERFMEEQYPLIYAKVYDLYHFKLVHNEMLDRFLKILILITILVVIGIFMVIVYQLLNLVS